MSESNDSEVPADVAKASLLLRVSLAVAPLGIPKEMGIRNQIRSESYTASLAFLPLSPQ